MKKVAPVAAFSMTGPAPPRDLTALAGKDQGPGGVLDTMKATIIAVAATALLAACGGGGYSNSTSSSKPAAASGSGPLSVKKVDGVGSVVVDSRGMAVYSPEQEADGKVRCTAGCTSFWTPVTTKGTRPAAPKGVAALGTVRRPDGSTQLTAGGKPLYTFTQDSPGKVNGNGVADAFGGMRFTWRALTTTGTPAPATPSPGSYAY